MKRISKKSSTTNCLKIEIIYMQKLIIALVLMFLAINVSAQSNYDKLPEKNGNCPMIIANQNIIVNKQFIEDYKDLVTQINIMKEKPNLKDHKFYNLSENGIVFAELDKKIKTKSQCELNKFFGLDKNNSVYINGYLIKDSEYKIAIESIIEIEVVIPNTINKLENKSINIWTISKEERINGCEN